MVVDQVDVVGIAIFEAEDHPPVAGNRDAPVPLQSALQRVKPVAGQVEVRGLAGIVKVRQGERDAVRQVRIHSARIAALVHALQAAMTKPSDHEGVYRIPVHISIGVVSENANGAEISNPGGVLALLHGPEQIADLPVPVGESPGAVSIGHAERGHLVEYLAPNSVFNSLPRQRSSPHSHS